MNYEQNKLRERKKTGKKGIEEKRKKIKIKK